MKKLLSVLLCLMMVLSTLSFSVSAADAQTVADSISVDTITTETANLITKNLTLPTEIDGQSVTWASNSDAITNTGVVTRHATEEKAVTLTATVGGTVAKEINLTVAPLTTMVIYQNNFGKQLNGTAFDTSKELIGATAENSQIANWTMSTAQNAAPFGTTVGATGGINLDLNARANSPTFTFPETMDSPFYVQFDVKTQAVAPGIDFRLFFTPEGGTSTLQMTYRWRDGNTLYLSSELPSGYGGTDFATTETAKTTMRIYIDPINLTMKFMDAKGNMVPAAGIKLGDAAAKNGKITTMNFCRAGSTSPAGYIEFDNFAVYRTADETQIYNDRILLGQLAESVKFADFSTEDESSVTANLDLGTFKNKIETENPGVTVTYNSGNEEILAIDGTTGVITRPFDDTAVKLEVVFSKGESTFGKTFEFTVEEAFNPAKQAANEIVFEMLSDDAVNAVTGNLDLSIDDFYALDVAGGAEVTFTSNDEEVLLVDGETGYISQGTEKKDVTLTATVTKEGRTFAKDFAMTVLPEGTYVYESENFGYPELVNESIGALSRWVITDNANRGTYADVKKNSNGYFLETARVKQGTYDDETFSFAEMRKTKKFTVEFDLSMDSIPAGVIHDVHFLGVKDGGLSVSDVTKDLLKFRITSTSLRLSGAADYEKTIKEGETYRLRFDFDFENETFDYYFNGTLVKSGIAWKTAGNYEALSFINFRSYRNSASFRIGVDNLAAYSINPEFTNSAIEDETNSDRPLTVSTSLDSYYQTKITTEYDENQNLCVGLVEKLETFENNPIIDFGTAELVDKNTGKKTSLNGYYSSDETNPQVINGLYIGSNHGAMGARVTSNNHGKTQADVGSVWTDANGTKWDLIRVEDANKLFFLQQKTYDLATQNFGFSGNIAGPLTYVSDGVNTGSITVGSYTATQTFPSIKNVEHTFYLVRDGEMIEFDNRTAGVSYKADEVVVVEEYDIVNPCTIAASLRANKPAGGYTEAPSIATGDAIFHYKQIITVKADGTIFTEIDHTVLTDLNSYETYGYQFYQRSNPYGGGSWRQVPGTKEFTDGDGVNWDITTPYEYTNVPGTPATNLPVPKSRTLTKADWINPDVVPSRILDFIRDADGKNVMGYMTGFLPIYDGEPSVRKTKTNSNIYMYDQKAKAYPIFVSSSGIADKAVLTAEGSRIHGVSYRKYVDLTGFEKNNTQYYAINHEDMTYYYVDFVEAGTLTLDLEASGCIYDLTKVESVGADITYEQVGDKIVVTSDGRGYLVLKAARQLEVESAYIKNEAIYARFVNYSGEAKTVDLTIASYEGKKLVDVKVIKNVTIGANGVLNKELEAPLKRGSKCKIFVVGSESGIVPVSKDREVEVR